MARHTLSPTLLLRFYSSLQPTPVRRFKVQRVLLWAAVWRLGSRRGRDDGARPGHSDPGMATDDELVRSPLFPPPPQQQRRRRVTSTAAAQMFALSVAAALALLLLLVVAGFGPLPITNRSSTSHRGRPRSSSPDPVELTVLAAAPDKGAGTPRATCHHHHPTLPSEFPIGCCVTMRLQCAWTGARRGTTCSRAPAPDRAAGSSISRGEAGATPCAAAPTAAHLTSVRPSSWRSRSTSRGFSATTRH